jgi:hypothetical protein
MCHCYSLGTFDSISLMSTDELVLGICYDCVIVAWTLPSFIEHHWSNCCKMNFRDFL